MGTSGNTELGSSWQNSASQDPVPEWRLPIQEDEPPDSDSAIYQKSTTDSYHGNSSSQRTPQKSTSNSTTAYSSATESKDRMNISSLYTDHLISLIEGSSSIKHMISSSQNFSVAGSQHSHV